MTTQWPRVLVLDASRMGDASATGQYLETIFSEWPPDARFSVWVDGGRAVGALTDTMSVDGDALVAAIHEFEPQLVFFRPDARSEALVSVEDRIDTTVPRVVNIVDDWVARLEDSGSEHAELWASRLDRYVRSSSARFAISPELAATLRVRYDLQFDVMSNVVDLALWDGLPGPTDGAPVEFRFSGQLAYRKGGSSVTAIALGVQGAENVDARFVIRNRGSGHERAYLRGLESLSRVRVEPFADDHDVYRSFLAAADVNVIAFNFDSTTRRYLRGSFANRVPELLAAGRPILAVGPRELATMRFLESTGAARCVHTPDAVEIHRAIAQLASDASQRAELGTQAQQQVGRFDRRTVLPQFMERLRDVAFGAQDTRPFRGPRGLSLPDRPTPTATPHHHAPSAHDMERLRSLRNAHHGETCVVVGNGPSLNDTNLDLLDDQIVFASNAIFLLFDDVRWRPRYYASVDSRFLPDRHEEVAALLGAYPSMTGFFPTLLELHDGSAGHVPTRTLLPALDNRVLFWSLSRKPPNTHTGAFSLDATAGLIQPSTVTITLMQLAAHMGFGRIVLIGCDTSYSIPDTVEVSGPQAEGQDEGMLLLSTKDDDVNHFRPDYFGAGRAWHHPKVDHMIRHYEAAKTVLGLRGIEVVNATVGGALEVYPRMDLGEALGRR